MLGEPYPTACRRLLLSYARERLRAGLADILALEVVLGVDLDTETGCSRDALEIDHALEPVMRDACVGHIKPRATTILAYGAGSVGEIGQTESCRAQHNVGLSVGIEDLMTNTLKLLDTVERHVIVVVMVSHIPDGREPIGLVEPASVVHVSSSVGIVDQLELKHDTSKDIAVKQVGELGDVGDISQLECKTELGSLVTTCTREE